jgi:hypothetical protein
MLVNLEYRRCVGRLAARSVRAAVASVVST